MESMRFALFVLLIFIYQFTGGVYMSAVTQMSGASSWMNEDVMMAGYASLIGMTMLFPVQFRVMFHFENRSVLIVSTIVLMIGTLICGYCDNRPIVVITCYICGVFNYETQKERTCHFATGTLFCYFGNCLSFDVWFFEAVAVLMVKHF